MNQSLAELGGMTAVLLGIGALLKHVIGPQTINRWIPVILLVVGMPLYFWIDGGVVTPESALSAFLQILGVTGIHQLAKRTSGKDV